MLEITPTFSIEEQDLHFDFIRSAGPGGQNVNKVATAVQLRFDVRASSLPEAAKERLLTLAGRRATAQGELLIEARRFRTQEQNREDAIQRFVELVRSALTPPRPRRQTKPTIASKAKRLETKKRRGKIKSLRKQPLDLD